MAEFKLPTGQIVLVDDADYERVVALKWHIGSRGYAKHSYRQDGKVKSLYLHEFIFGKKFVDHHDGNPLNNQRSNLRPATSSQNAGNSRAPARKKSSQFKGVYKAGKKWNAQLGARGNGHYLGRFDDEVEAAKAYDAAAILRWGDFARLNFPA